MSETNEVFWTLAEELKTEDARVSEGTLMGGRCIRVGEAFLALPDHKGSGMVVKLPRERVLELIEDGVATPFAPAGRVFREWAAIPEIDADVWRRLLREGITFVG